MYCLKYIILFFMMLICAVAQLSKEDMATLQEIRKERMLKDDYTKIVTANKCGECHQNEKKVWENTPHFFTFDELPKRPRAKKIFENLGEKGTIKRSDRCMKCHFTQADDRGKPKPISGVSCESCHGAGKDWIYVHNDKNVPKMERRKNAMEKGMNNPEDIYLIAQNCFECHSVPDEELVNKGGHKAGSTKYDFVRWSQGMIRHNFVRTSNKENAKTTKERLRVMFITGLMLDLEYSIRRLALATKNGPFYQDTMTDLKTSFGSLNNANKKSGGIAEVTELIDIINQVKSKLKPGNKNALETAADLVTLKAKKFTRNHDGSKLSSLDSIIPKEEDYVWKRTPRD